LRFHFQYHQRMELAISKKRGRPKTDNKPTLVRLPPDVSDALDQFAKKDESRPKAVVRALRSFLADRGLLEP
jgi:hypothetical protein